MVKSSSGFDGNGEYWLLTNNDDIRPYGLCLYKNDGPRNRPYYQQAVKIPKLPRVPRKRATRKRKAPSPTQSAQPAPASANGMVQANPFAPASANGVVQANKYNFMGYMGYMPAMPPLPTVPFWTVPPATNCYSYAQNTTSQNVTDNNKQLQDLLTLFQRHQALTQGTQPMVPTQQAFQQTPSTSSSSDLFAPYQFPMAYQQSTSMSNSPISFNTLAFQPVLLPSGQAQTFQQFDPSSGQIQAPQQLDRNAQLPFSSTYPMLPTASTSQDFGAKDYFQSIFNWTTFQNFAASMNVDPNASGMLKRVTTQFL